MKGEGDVAADYIDPLPQALILTAIVIAFGVTAFLVVLSARAVEEHGDDAFLESGAEEGED